MHAVGVDITVLLGGKIEDKLTTAQPLLGQQPEQTSCMEGLGCLSLTVLRVFVSHPSVTALSHPIAPTSNLLFPRSFSSKPSYQQGETKTQLQYSSLAGRILDSCVGALCILLLPHSATLATSHPLSMMFLLPILAWVFWCCTDTGWHYRP